MLPLLPHAINFIGVPEAKTELRTDWTSCKINTLCNRQKSNVDVVCFTVAASLLPFAWKFDVMTKHTNSSIFDATWSTVMQQACTNNPNISISHIEVLVWTRAFKHCQIFEEKQLVHELKALSAGVAKCLKQPNDDQWIHPSVRRIEEYRKLCGYRDAANSFLELRDSLNLRNGDFKDVERISKEV